MKKLIALSIAALTLAFAVPQALSAAGSVGENKAGYLEAMTKETAGKEVKLSDDEKKLVEAENKDRKAVYNAIAKQEGSTVDKVGELRAKQIRSKANEGDYIQGEDGKWVKAPKPAPAEKK